MLALSILGSPTVTVVLAGTDNVDPGMSLTPAPDFDTLPWA